MQQDNIINVNIDLIIPGKHQPRKFFNEDSLNELAKSIKEYGILNPILVTKSADKYEIIAGERRYRAAKKIGLTEVPVIVKTLDESAKAEIALIENLQRENLNPIEEAKSYQEIIKLGNLTQQLLGDKLGKSQSSIANKIRLLTLPKTIQDALSNNKISERHARSLMTIKDETEQNRLLNKVIENKMTVKELDNLINQESITEKEIKEAINDIMKIINIPNEKEFEEKKEEKESDNMNNGNFFPNYNNTMGSNDNISLNSMNMQSMESSPMPQMPETVMPTAPIQTPTMEPIMQPMNNMPQMAPSMKEQPMPMPEQNISFDAPLFNPLPEPTMPTVEPQMIQEPMVNELPIQDTPLFGGNFESPMPQMPENIMPPVNEPIIEQPIAPTLEVSNLTNVIEPNTNLFESPMPPVEPTTVEPQMIQEPMVTPSFEIPVTTEPTVDKLTEVKMLLDQNGINYKAYSNESSHCIIIEI